MNESVLSFEEKNNLLTILPLNIIFDAFSI